MKTCQSCVYFKPDDNTCRRNAPTPGLAASPAVVWPKVADDDWCAEGYNTADGFYTQSPAVGHG